MNDKDIDTLSPLPEPWIFGGVMHAPLEGTYTAQQMRDYALQERAAEHERWHSALARRFPPGEVAIEGWKCRMVLYDTNGKPCALRQPSHAELRDALAAPEWPQ